MRTQNRETVTCSSSGYSYSRYIQRLPTCFLRITHSLFWFTLSKNLLSSLFSYYYPYFSILSRLLQQHYYFDVARSVLFQFFSAVNVSHKQSELTDAWYFNSLSFPIQLAGRLLALPIMLENVHKSQARHSYWHILPIIGITWGMVICAFWMDGWMKAYL